MSYISKRLFDGEEICYEGRFHWLDRWGAWFALVILGVFLIGIVIFIRNMVRFATTEFVVTNRRVICKRGLLKAKMVELDLDAIEGANIAQGFWGRIFRFGKVEIHGRGESEITFPRMALPGRFLAEVERARMLAQQAPFEQMAERLRSELSGQEEAVSTVAAVA